MSLVSMFHERVEQGGDASALLIKRRGEFVSVSCQELGRDVRRAAVALDQLGRDAWESGAAGFGKSL